MVVRHRGFRRLLFRTLSRIKGLIKMWDMVRLFFHFKFYSDQKRLKPHYKELDEFLCGVYIRHLIKGYRIPISLHKDAFRIIHHEPPLPFRIKFLSEWIKEELEFSNRL